MAAFIESSHWLSAVDVEESRRRATRAQQNTSSTPWLVGFEAIGIQDLIAANGRPLAMQGASTLVDDFDRANLDEPPQEGYGGIVFAGGGRGLSVVPFAHVDGAIETLRRRYEAQTCGGQLAVAKAPLGEDQGASLRWLRLLLDGAKDSAEAPRVPVPLTHDQRCTDCKLRRIETEYEGPEGPVASCRLCRKIVERGRTANKPSQQRWTLEELATNGAIAVVSADGNNLGSLFASLSSLVENAICSDLVRDIFTRAHRRALPGDHRYVDPVVGGDDIRVFLPPEHLLSYVTTLAREVETQSRAIATRHGLPRAIVNGLSKLGVGIGAVIAPYHFPASRLIDMAHSFEDSAKKACIRGNLRSAFDFLWLRSGQELSQGLDALDAKKNRPPALSLESEAWDRYHAKAHALKKVPPTQRSMLIQHDHHPNDDAELANRYRYQVVRHQAWKEWFEACGVDWRDEVALANNLPDRRLADVAGLIELEPEGTRR